MLFFSTFKGMIEPKEVKAALANLGLNIDLEEAEKLTKRYVLYMFT